MLAQWDAAMPHQTGPIKIELEFPAQPTSDSPFAEEGEILRHSDFPIWLERALSAFPTIAAQGNGRWTASKLHKLVHAKPALQELVAFCLQSSMAKLFDDLGLEVSVIYTHGDSELHNSALKDDRGFEASLVQRWEKLASDPLKPAPHKCAATDLRECAGHMAQNALETNSWADFSPQLAIQVGRTSSQALDSIPIPCGPEIFRINPFSEESFLRAIGRLWELGASVDWQKLNAGRPFRRVHLPAYPFQKVRCWIEPSKQSERTAPRKPTPNVEIKSADSSPRGLDNIRVVLQRIWQEALGVSHVGLQDDYFELGGDSLSALRLLSQIKETLGIEITVDLLFECSSIERMAPVIDALLWNNSQAIDRSESCQSTATVMGEI